MALHLQYYGSWALLLLLRMMKTYSPRTMEKCGHKTSKCKRKKLDMFFFPWVECTGNHPVRQFLPALKLRTVSFSRFMCSRNVQRHCTYTKPDRMPLRSYVVSCCVNLGILPAIVSNVLAYHLARHSQDQLQYVRCRQVQVVLATLDAYRGSPSKYSAECSP